MSAHFALADPTNKFNNDETRIIEVSSAHAGILVELKVSAVDGENEAQIRPREHSHKVRGRKGEHEEQARSSIAPVIIFTRSR